MEGHFRPESKSDQRFNGVYIGILALFVGILIL
jgi:hypothetical protein